MKACSKCKETKELSEFYYRKDSGKYKNNCKVCIIIGTNARSKELYKTQKKKMNAHSKAWYYANRERKLAKAREWSADNRDKRAAYTAKYRAAKLQRTPNWLTNEDWAKIEEFYQLAADLTDIVGLPYHVDHIIPLQGSIVSGLHCPSNLQVIPATENQRKGNRYND